MGCNTSQEAAQKVEDEKKSAEAKKVEVNHAGGEKDQLQDITEEIKSESTDAEKAEEEKAATKIQAVFRGHRTRKSIASDSGGGQVSEGHQEIMSDKKPEPEPTKEELEAEFNPEDKELCHAATKIQASFRGHQVRKQAEQATAKEVEELSAKAEELDIDLTDPELNKAATKIQASFRGHKANARH